MLANYSPPFGHEEDFVVLNAEGSKLLSIRTGSLSPDERLEIQSHVTHTRALDGGVEEYSRDCWLKS